MAAAAAAAAAVAAAAAETAEAVARGNAALLGVLTAGGIQSLHGTAAVTAAAPVVLCVKHIFRVFPTKAYEVITGRLRDYEFEAVLTDGSDECKCILLDPEPVLKDLVGVGSVVAITSASTTLSDHVQPALQVVLVEKFSPAIVAGTLPGQRVQEAELLGGRCSAKTCGLPLLGDRDYYLDLKYNDISAQSAALMLDENEPFTSSVAEQQDTIFKRFLSQVRGRLAEGGCMGGGRGWAGSG